MKIDWPSYIIEGVIVAGCLWLFWCTWHNIDPIGWFH